MSHRRRRLVTWFISLLLGLQVLAIVVKHDNWPFSCFPMFSSVQGPKFHRPSLCGVSVDGRELVLDHPNYWRPFRNADLHTTIGRNLRRDQRARRRDPAAAVRTDNTIQALFELYDRNRNAGWHQGPPLAALRLYVTTWELDPERKNLDLPLAKELIYEAAAPH